MQQTAQATAASSPVAGAARSVEQYTIRRKVFKILGAGFHIYDHSGALVGYCKQRALRIREDLRIYTDETCSEELLVISTRSVFDISGAYTVSLRSGDAIGAFKRHGIRSVLRDKWSVFGPGGEPLGEIREDSAWRALVRRGHELLAALVPQRFEFLGPDERRFATYRTHMNPVVHRLGVAIHEQDDLVDELLILAGGCLLMAIEQRQ